jgi:ABC-2 type transport system permease protein
MSVAPGARATPAYLLRPRLTGLRNRWQRATGRQKLAYGLFGFFGLAFWAGLLATLILLLGAFYELDVFGPIITRKLLELLMLALLAMLLFSNVVTALSTFYLSDDLELLLSLPISRPMFYYTRLLDALGQSGWMMAMFGLPVFIAYGVVFEAGWPYYLSLAAVIPCFLLLPAAFGAGLSTILVNVFPARKTREALALAGVLLVIAVFGLLRVMRPERLLNAEDFGSLAQYVAELQAPVPPLFPSRWASDVLLATLQQRVFPWEELGLLVLGALGLTGAVRWLTDAMYDTGWTKSQEAREARLARAGWFDRALKVLVRPLPEGMGPIILKDARVFIRDPAQWSQLFLLASLIGIYLFSVKAFPTDAVRGPYLSAFKNGLAFLNLGMAGFVMAGIAVRFQFTAVSTEGRAFWMIRTSPIDPERYLWAKALPSMIPMILVGEILIVASSLILDSPLALLAIGAGNGVALGCGISGIAVGMGAAFPDFKADNAARAAGGPAGILFMVTALCLVAAVVALEAWPVYLLLRSDFTGEALTGTQLGVSAGLLVFAVVLCAVATIYPIRKAAPDLWQRSI